MGLQKLIKKLENYLNGKKNHCDEIRELLEKLGEKQEKIERKLEAEEGTSKRKSLKLELKIIHAQSKKAKKMLRKKCD
jgi:hypothetical protein